MPPDDPPIASSAPRYRPLSPTLSPVSFSEHPQRSQFPGVFDILRLARSDRLVDERFEGFPALRSEDLQHQPLVRTPTANPSSVSSPNSLTSIPRQHTSSASGAGRRQDRFRYRILNNYIPMIQNPSQPHRAQSTSQLARHRLDHGIPPRSGGLSPSSDLLLRELDADDFSSRLSMLRANALLMRDDLERAMEELGLPLHRPHSDSIPPRNHHRHSSMSTSPRVLETAHSTTASPHRPAGSVDEKLEGALFFLDAQLQHHFGPHVPTVPTVRFSESLVSECSWLRPGSKFQGIQIFRGSPVPTISSISRELHALQAFQSEEWTVEVVVECIDYSNMSIAGSMTASPMLPPNALQKAKTFWTGEVSLLPLLFGSVLVIIQS